ncbi:MAG: neutral zinc metallopeptidase [Hydrogenophaga sp.]|uniref:KPN_02809 family neutral zinc metallopeptidase n=1 Tax=Hydrogenophaga sp. TaxID=1904254 RepID=UPI001DBA1305|nr:neutral zinc metallopeptidase [Hydrogenophaga sp.]MBX3608493.1 neutral zinc metallopeptidase [Hydrogenophaga sp.]
MKWENNRASDQIEDRRNSPGGMGRAPRLGGGRGIGLGTIAIALIAGWVFGINPLTILGALDGGGLQAPTQVEAPQGQSGAPSDDMGRFVASVLGGTEDAWDQIFRESGSQYQKPRLVLFRGATPTACGTGQAAMGPFYCPADRQVYIDLSFYDTLRRQLGAPGDFAQAYVIAHEVGHHVQNLLGITDQMEKARGRMGQREYNALSVRLELQADCFAGIWAHRNQQTRQILEPGDIDEALNAAAAIGDDTLQRQSQGQVVPDSFTHGTSDQRQRWFRTGLETGDVRACDTFKAARL